MLLTIDVGNTQTVMGVFRGEELIQHWRVSTEHERTADELALIIQGFLLLEGMSFSREITGVAISSVVPRVTQTLREMTTRYFHFDPVVVGPGIKTGVPILIDNPREVGADRITNAVGALHLYEGPIVVVDFGTATTFDAISAKGEYLGGAIAPGIEVSTAALAGAGAQLRSIELIRPRSVIGKSTVESLQSGVIFGFAGQVDGLVGRIIDEMGGKAEVVATGGLAPAVISECTCIDHHEPWLTLLGLRLIFERNTPAT
ncbi:MAG: type III pantothenate kinase [Actinomycetota bacterium]